MINVMQPLAMEKNIELIYRRSDNAICIFSDDEKIKHIMQNLVSNAIKFTDNGYVEISTTQKESRVAISVSDTGIGMEESSLLYIFDEFRQVDNTTSRRYGGTGLGLAIVKEYLELLGGSISVKSTLGKGSIFTIEIPLNTCQGDTKEQDL
jgi:two-component system sensor histidine kinase ChiS